MTSRLLIITGIIFIFTLTQSRAQEITGFWEVTKVSMQGQTMTPVAKWTKINTDGTYQTGNGWLQNAVGTWTYDAASHTFSPEETNGITDEFGPFTVSFQNESMIWKRMEEGAEVTVELQQIEQLPMSTADQIKGLWDLSAITESGEDITSAFDPNGLYYLFIRWDRIYQGRNPKGENMSGYWHINGHRPEITLLSHTRGKEPQSWRVVVSENELVLSGISDSNKNMVMTFNRIDQFPE
ncbi:hypothetical protein G3570_01425 [Balneolaceae bacterium YR4-1]|uniref:Lipocalin-like domain-containing protein n=1 Tax=Halalkalibaculum roseum TaxID=2709311 RepID=A0A6M1ST41_9BACT|nr:hypothetical protein [Halalkalibaculum roseum]NGP75278.1 hypothetical protein [Halalkalibaculum roseum]